jgi:hypothetical protein
MVLLISYDLNGRERPASYLAVKRAIETHSIASRKPLYSQWWVQTQRSATYWTDLLAPALDSDDRLFVCRVRVGEYEGMLTDADWKWLRTRVR